MWVIDVVMAAAIVYLYLRLKRVDKQSREPSDSYITVIGDNAKDVARDVMDKHVREYHQ